MLRQLPKKKKNDNEEKNLQRGIDLSRAAGLYFHLNSRRKSEGDWVVQIGHTIVLHGIRIYSFLDKEVIKRLEVLRHAYHKLDTMVKSDAEHECLKRLVWPYFRFFDE